jgi:hypothetical protein
MDPSPSSSSHRPRSHYPRAPAAEAALASSRHDDATADINEAGDGALLQSLLKTVRSHTLRHMAHGGGGGGGGGGPRETRVKQKNTLEVGSGSSISGAIPSTPMESVSSSPVSVAHRGDDGDDESLRLPPLDIDSLKHRFLRIGMDLDLAPRSASSSRHQRKPIAWIGEGKGWRLEAQAEAAAVALEGSSSGGNEGDNEGGGTRGAENAIAAAVAKASHPRVYAAAVLATSRRTLKNYTDIMGGSGEGGAEG